MDDFTKLRLSVSDTLAKCARVECALAIARCLRYPLRTVYGLATWDGVALPGWREASMLGVCVLFQTYGLKPLTVMSSKLM